MNLITLTEPFFRYICTLKKLAASKNSVSKQRVSGELGRIFNSMSGLSEESSQLRAQYEKIKLPLVFFADFMIYESGLKLDTPWTTLASEFGELAGEEKFFDMLAVEIEDRSKEAAERLAIYYTCLSLGFNDAYLGDKTQLGRDCARIYSRLETMYDIKKNSKLTSQAYSVVDKRDFTAQIGTKVGGLGIVLVCLVVLWFACCITVYKTSCDEIAGNIATIEEAVDPSASGATATMEVMNEHL